MNLLRRLSIVIGSTVLLACIVSLAAPKKARALVATLVQITNTPASPVPVTEVGTQQPFDYTCNSTLTGPAGSNSCYITIPAGKRLVALNASARIFVDAGVFVNFTFLFLNNGQYAEQFLTVPPPIDFNPGSISYSISQPILAYVDPGTTSYCNIDYISTFPVKTNGLSCTISGYLVDVP
jgi:hypothetical protein